MNGDDPKSVHPTAVIPSAPRCLGAMAALVLVASCTDGPAIADDGDSSGGDVSATDDESNAASDSGTAGTAAAELHDEVAAVVPEGSNGGVIALVVRDGVLAQAVAGTATVDGDLLAPDSTFNIASVTKTYTATLIYQLEDQGRLDTAAPLSDYLPETDYGPDVTLDTLLSHRSGIPDYAENPAYFADILSDLDRVFTTEELIAYSNFEPPAPAGETYAYSNTGYSLLGLVIERVTDGSLAEALEAGIVAPLGLTSTSFIDPPDFPDDLPSAWLDPTELGLPAGTELPVMPVPAPFSGCQADCGIITTAPELRIFFEALFDGTLVSEASLAKMTTSEPDAPREGRGLEIFDLGAGVNAYGHGGGGTGYTSIVAYEPTSADITIFFASNDAFDVDPLFRAYGL